MDYFLYVSLFDEDKILTFALDPTVGRLRPRGGVLASQRPGSLTTDPAERFLYAGCRGSCEIWSFRIDHATGGLLHIGTAALESDPCFLATDRKGHFLLSSYYQAGKVAIHRIGDDGAVKSPPIEWLNTAKGAHSVQTDPSNRFAFVPHIAEPNGTNAIFQFRFDEITGCLSPNSPPQVVPHQRVGPRHFCFHPSLNVVYFVNEQGCSVTAYLFDPSVGTLKSFQTISSVPEGYKGKNSCAEIRMSPTGKFLYASNRGHNSIACFRVDSSTGSLTSVGQVPTEAVPRAFTLDPEGNYLFAAGLESGRLACYRINPATGELAPLEVYPAGKGSMWVLIIRRRS